MVRCFQTGRLRQMILHSFMRKHGMEGDYAPGRMCGRQRPFQENFCREGFTGRKENAYDRCKEARKYIHMYERKILPFYMTYPLPMYYEEEETIIRDLEYLQQMYPKEAKRYQKVISGILDKLDYEGSMIYDEYPDKWQLYKLSKDITDRIRREDEKADPSCGDMPEKWEWMGDLVQILLCYEIYKRRHNSRRGILRF